MSLPEMFNATCQLFKCALKKLRRAFAFQSRAHLPLLANPSTFVPVSTVITGPTAGAHALHVRCAVKRLASR